MNSETQVTHTPGPWEWIAGETGNCYIFSADENPVELAFVKKYESGPIQQALPSDANAALMSAAPELLAALRDIVDNHVDVDDNGDCGWCGRTLPMYEFSSLCDSDDCAGVKARAAIAKATGGPA